MYMCSRDVCVGVFVCSYVNVGFHGSVCTTVRGVFTRAAVSVGPTGLCLCVCVAASV